MTDVSNPPTKLHRSMSQTSKKSAVPIPISTKKRNLFQRSSPTTSCSPPSSLDSSSKSFRKSGPTFPIVYRAKLERRSDLEPLPVEAEEAQQSLSQLSKSVPADVDPQSLLVYELIEHYVSDTGSNSGCDSDSELSVEDRNDSAYSSETEGDDSQPLVQLITRKLREGTLRTVDKNSSKYLNVPIQNEDDSASIHVWDRDLQRESATPDTLHLVKLPRKVDFEELLQSGFEVDGSSEREFTIKVTLSPQIIRAGP
ncbi:hypothetical protein HK102_013996 [Quaeritorhiza haematococci]|nr:hypothetical protein HK102_013996 [Quaeritorhiza haematococci]